MDQTSNSLQNAATKCAFNDDDQPTPINASLMQQQQQQADNYKSLSTMNSMLVGVFVDLAQTCNFQSAASAFVAPVVNFFVWVKTFEDKRVDSYPLMSSSLPVLVIFALYLFMANYGPQLMANRKPLQLRFALIAYNLYIASLNFWIAAELSYCAYKLNYKSLCLLVEPKNSNEYQLRVANAVWWYFASKGFEFADTLFFVLRKKDRQLTFLHKYHHSTMFIVWWTAVRFVPGGSAIVPIVINSLVHVLMYSYYGLSAVGPSMARYLWWKKHLTLVQLVQFFVGVSIGIYLITSNCQFTRWMQYVFSGYAFSFIILFGNFYLHEYSEKRKKASLNCKAAASSSLSSKLAVEAKEIKVSEAKKLQ